MKKVKKNLKCKKMIKNNKKKSNFKKIFLSSLAAFSLTITIGVSSLGVNRTSSSIIGTNSTKNADTTSTLTPPNMNDLYDDYAYTNGYVFVSESVINFYDWFGFKLWSYDLNANAATLFGNQALKVATLHVRSSTDGNLIYVYGYLLDDSSYLFALNSTNGSISPIQGHDSYSGNDLIKDVNLLTIADNCLILTPKTPDDENVGSSNETVTITFSEIDLSSGTATTNDWDISGSKASLGVTDYGYGEIISVQKVQTNYLFIMKALVYNGTNTTQARACVIYVDVKDGVYQKYGGLMASFWAWTTPNDPTGTDLDMANFMVMNATSSDGSTSYSYVTVKYDTTSTTLGNPDGSAQNAYSNPNKISYSTLTASAPSVSVVTYQSNNTTSDNFVGVSQLLINPIDNTPSAIFLDGNSTSKVAIQSLSTINSVASGKTITVTPSWIDLSSSGITTSNNQILSFDFLPKTANTTTQVSSGYYGYLNVQIQNDPSLSTLTSSSTFFSLDSSGTKLTTLTLDFTYAMSDSEIENKYEKGKYKANATTKNALINDLAQINYDGNTYDGVTYTDNINIDETNNTLKGDVTIAIPNWWNSDKSTLTRLVSLDLDSPTTSETVTSNGTSAAFSVMEYAAIVLFILIVIAIALVVIKAVVNKKTSKI